MGLGPFWFVLIAFVVMGYCVAFTRKGTVKNTTLGSNKKVMFNQADVKTVFERLATINDSKLKVDDKDPATNIIVFSSPVTFFTWGFLYPVYLHDTGKGTRIDVGIRSKFVQWGPLVGRAHDQCVAAIEAALSVPTARVA